MKREQRESNQKRPSGKGKTANKGVLEKKLQDEVRKRKQTEEALVQSERRYRAIVEFQTELICRYLPDTTLTFVNGAYCRFFGKTQNELLGTKFIALIPEESRGYALEVVQRLCLTRTPVRAEHAVIASNGEIRYQEWVDQVIEDEAGGLLELQAVGRDVTDRRAAEEERRILLSELHHVTRMAAMGEIAASIAHEVNQPLTAIVTNGSVCLSLFASNQGDSEELLDAVKDIVRDGKRASEVIARIRSFLKRDSPEPEVFDINCAVQDFAALTQYEVSRHQVIFQLDLADNPLIVRGDRVQLQQVLFNLVRNGIDAMLETTDIPRNLKIKSYADSQQIRIDVMDSGNGIDPQRLNLVFEPFFTTKTHGMGIGLSISRSIVEAHGGRLFFESGSRCGTTFSFTLPRVQALRS